MKINISYSNYSLLRQCGQKYHLKIGQGLTESKAVPLEFGSALHAGLHSALETKDVEQSQDMFQTYWDSSQKGLDYKNERYKYEELTQTGNKFVRRFIEKYAKGMEFIVGEKRMFGLWGSNTHCEGTPDALVTWNGETVLLDYKSSAYNYLPEKHNISLQLNLYAWLLEKNGYKVDKLCYFVFNKATGSIQTPVLVKYDQKKCLQMINDMVSYFIRNKDGVEKNPNACIISKSVCSFYERCWK